MRPPVFVEPGMQALLGRKVGMTRYFTEDGRNVPVTVIEAGPCIVTQVKTTPAHAYSAVQLGFEDVKPRRSTRPLIGHDARAGAGPKRVHRELRLPDDDAAAAFRLGQTLDVSVFEGVRFVDVTGTSKGKGFAGVMKRHGFGGQPASHGTERKHRSPGAIGARAANRGQGPIKKGQRMAGRMGAARVTVRSLDLVGVDPQRNLLLVKGPVPGPNEGLLMIRSAKRLYGRKAKPAAKGK
jgi:large subunit ribosomal protein L3